MTIAGPTLVGSAFGRNQTANSPLTFHPAATVPVGSFLVLLLGTDAPDTSTCALSDNKGNSYAAQVNLTSDPNNPGFAVSVFFCTQTTVQLLTTDTISMSCDVRSSYGGAMYSFSGTQNAANGGGVYSLLTKFSSEWSATPLNPNGTVLARTGDSVFSCLAVAGPNNDVFTQDTNGWAADLQSAAGNFNAALHATAKHNIASDGNVSWSPTLNNARNAVMAMFSFK